MKRLLLVLMILALAVPGGAQQRTVVNEAMTVAGTATTFAQATLDAIQVPNPTCTGVLETAPIRMTLDGTTPTASVGVPVAIGQQITVFGYANIANFKAIRTTSTSGSIYWSCSK